MNAPALRVVLDVTPLLGPPTGVHQTTVGLLTALRGRADVDVSGYVLSFRGQVSGRSSRPPGLEDLPVVSRHWPAAVVHRCWARTDLPAGSWVAGPGDVIHGTNYTTPPSRHGRVVTVHDLTLFTHPHWCSSQVLGMRGALSRAVGRGAHVHVPSDETADHVSRHLGVTEARIHVVPNAITPLGPGDPERGRELVGAEEYVLALGSTDPRKGLARLPAAVVGLDRRVALAVVGPPGADEDGLVRAVRDAGLGDRFRRIVAVDASTRSDLMRGASVLAYPSRVEGFGLPPLEALSVGCPVVATAVGALPELIGDLVDLLPPDDQDALADALRLATSTPRRVPEELSARLAGMTWDGVAEQMVGVYRQAAA